MTDLRQELMRGEQWTLEVRTSDPQNPAADERWIRSDLDSGDKIATYRTGDGTDMPIYPTGTAEDTVSEAIRIEVSGQTGYVPIAPESDAEFQSRQVQHNGQRYAHHNSVSPGAGIPDSDVWYDATELTGFSDGDPVSTWPDKSGPNDLTAGAAPTYQTSVLNDNPVVRFDGVDDYLQSSFAALSEPWQVYVVARFRSIGSTQAIWGDASDGAPALFENGRSNWTVKYDGETDLEGSSVDTNWHILSVLSGSSDVLRVDGSDDATVSNSPHQLNGFTVGARGSLDSYGATDVGEILIYDSSLSATDRDSVESYLSDKWGITI